jgi:hypothetical protein
VPVERRPASAATIRDLRNIAKRPAGGSTCSRYGLMAAGERGVERVADILEPEFLRTMRLLRTRNVEELGPDRVRARDRTLTLTRTRSYPRPTARKR